VFSLTRYNMKKNNVGVLCSVYGKPSAGMTNIMMYHMEKIIK